MSYQVELLAPAGSMEAFLGAVHAGADAVYLGGNKYGARAYADNFSEEELIFCIRYAHLFGRKLYLTVNTLMKDQELEQLYDYIVPLYEAGLDACIVQDLGAFQYLRKNFPQMELHVSTQMTITGEYGAAFLKELGASRIVPARELSLAEIRQMKERTGLEMETFIHGAMCYCYSGQCLFSSILGGRSGNRGRCAQPCRLPYRVNTGSGSTGECYPLSLKDMCTLEHIEDLMEAGIDSFKIEGRMKKPEYAAGVTAIYRKYIDLKKKNPGKKLNFQKKDLDQLSRLYIRSERQDGYYFKQNGRDMISLDNPAYSGSDEALLQEIRRRYIETRPKLKVSVYANMVCGETFSVTILYKNLSVTVEGERVEKAQNSPLSAESIEKQLQKLGDTVFEADTMEIYTDGESFYSLKALNELRRRAVKELEDLIIADYHLPVNRKLTDKVEMVHKTIISRETADKRVNTLKSTENWTILLSSEPQLKAFQQYRKHGTLPVSRIYLESELLLNGAETLPDPEKQSIYIALPYCMRKKDEEKLNRLFDLVKKYSYRGFLVRNIEEYAWLKEKGYEGEIQSDAGLYIWNHESLAFWQGKLTGISCPLELNRKEYKSLFEGQTYEKLTYGRIPMMVTANCVAKNTGKCLHGTGSSVAELTDRYQKKFPVAVDCAYCLNIIYNSVPVSLHKELAGKETSFEKKLAFTVESERETQEILQFFEAIAKGEEPVAPFGEYTTAHEKRGVE